MARSMFGWSYPPGVSGNEPEITGEYGPCECCGMDHADCCCPECPVCGEAGNPNCYTDHGEEKNHGLEYSTLQLIGLSRMRIYNLKQELYYEGLAYIQLNELLNKEKADEESGQSETGKSGTGHGNTE
jgi:hypothetical protein